MRRYWALAFADTLPILLRWKIVQDVLNLAVVRKEFKMAKYLLPNGSTLKDCDIELVRNLIDRYRIAHFQVLFRCVVAFLISNFSTTESEIEELMDTTKYDEPFKPYHLVEINVNYNRNRRLLTPYLSFNTGGLEFIFHHIRLNINGCSARDHEKIFKKYIHVKRLNKRERVLVKRTRRFNYNIKCGERFSQTTTIPSGGFQYPCLLTNEEKFLDDIPDLSLPLMQVINFRIPCGILKYGVDNFGEDVVLDF